MESKMQYLQTKVFGYSIEKNQYTLNVGSGLTRTVIKQWVELFFGVKVIAMNSHRLSGKGIKNRTHYGTYNALQTYDHYPSTGLFYFTSQKEKSNTNKQICSISRRKTRAFYLLQKNYSCLEKEICYSLIKIYIVHQLIIIVIYTPEDLLEIEGLGAKDRDEIVRKVHYFIFY